MTGSQTLPPPQGPEYARCVPCGHIEPEHRPDGGPCLVCDCAAYRPAAAPTDEDFLFAVEEALESVLLPEPGIAALERTRDAVTGALAPLVAELRRAAVPSAPAGRAAILREAVERLRQVPFTNVLTELRRMADEAQQPETLPPPEGPEYTLCACGHIEPEHSPAFFRRCLECGCLRYRPVAAAVPQPDADDAPPAPLRRSWDDCPGFPERCPNLRPVDPDPPVHLGGIRCGCADQTAP